ncbi:MAG: helix-turn-helix domain-containing protein [Rhizobiaceae bacterium]
MKAGEVIAWNLRRLRVAKGLSQESLAGDSDIDVSYVSRLENAKENPSIGVLERLAAALGTDFFELVRKPARPLTKLKNMPKGRKRNS